MRFVPCGAIVAGSALVGAFGASAQSHPSAATDGIADTNAPGRGSRLWAASIRWENDLFGGTDRFYTDGISIAVSHTGPSWLDPFADRLPWGRGRRTVGYDVTQSMVTPGDTSVPVPDPRDRPYAGILAIGLSLHVERSNSYHGLKFTTGLVGPWSFAEETQREIHHLVGSKVAQGWDHQLENEPILNLTYEYRHKILLAGLHEKWSFEVQPRAAGMVGNLLTQAQIGGYLRFGYNMPDYVGVTLARGMGHVPPPRWDASSSRSRWGFSIHGGGIASLVLRDMTLDGNTFEDGPSVDKTLFVPAAGVGISIGTRRFLTSFAYVFWGKEYERQNDYSAFGSISVTYVFR